MTYTIYGTYVSDNYTAILRILPISNLPAGVALSRIALDPFSLLKRPNGQTIEKSHIATLEA